MARHEWQWTARWWRARSEWGYGRVTEQFRSSDSEYSYEQSGDV